MIEKSESDSLQTIQNFLNDASFKEYIENAANYNVRLKIEKNMRLPFLDSQTGVAQNHSFLWMPQNLRMPGLRHGQIITYPAKRWKKRKRSYLVSYVPQKFLKDPDEDDIAFVNEFSTINEDSKDAVSKEEQSKETWYYDELEYPEPIEYEDIDADSDYDYEEAYMKKKKKKISKSVNKLGLGRGRKKAGPSLEPKDDCDKPYVCDYCGVRYKTRPGLSYHYTHTHKARLGSTHFEEPEEELATLSPKFSQDSSSSFSLPALNNSEVSTGVKKFQDSFLSFLKVSGKLQQRINEEKSEMEKFLPEFSEELQQPTPIAVVEKTFPSPYCDFCLGNIEQNRKTGKPEELVSCSDCGRSGHPTCLQFTANMIISVKKYHWQCIECKCCTLCGNSDNDDQLLFCDDCDRGYHMYCLDPPLTSPPEGSWSCHLCLKEFHNNMY